MADPWEEAWEEAAASAPKDKIELFTLELLHPAFLDDLGNPTSVRAVRDTRDHTLLHEADAPMNPSAAVLYKGIPFDMPWPEQSEGQVPRLTIRIDHVSREIIPWLDAATDIGAPIVVILRVYLYTISTGLTEMATDRITFPLRSVAVNETSIEGSASPADLANLQAMRLVYDLKHYPGLDIAG